MKFIRSITVRPVSIIFLIALLVPGFFFELTDGTDILAAPTTPGATVPIELQQISDDITKLMLAEPVRDLPTVEDARWSSRWTGSTLVALIVWIGLMILLSIAGRPLALVLFGSFPDAGAGFARLLILLIAGWLVWFAASFQLIEFRVLWAWYAVLATTVVGYLLAGQISKPKDNIETRRAIRGAEVAFWIVFAIFLTFRFFNPDSWHPIWGGEKPMEFAHINALLRTPYFPVFDPWFSDGILNYYYYGEYLVAFLIKLTGIPSEIAFNLAQPTFMGLAASAMYTIVAAIAHRLSRDRIDPLIAGGLGVLIFCLMGNLVAAWTFIRSLPNRPEFSFAWTWDASRAIDGGITEFPYFTGLYADLHAHLIALPITLLVVGLGFALATTDLFFRSQVPKLILLGLSLGTLSAANMWDLPVYSILTLAAIFLWNARLGSFPRQVIVTALISAGVALLAYGLFRPFHDHFVTLFDELGRVPKGTNLGQFALHFGGLLGILGISLATSGLFSWSLSQPRWRFVITAVFVAVVLIGIAWQEVHPELQQFESGVTITVLLASLAAGAVGMVLLRAGSDPYFAALAMIATVAGMAYLVSIGWPVLAIGLFLATGGALVFFSFADRSASFFGLLLSAAGAVIAGVDIVFVVDDLASLPDWFRMNTIFKLYYGVWTMLSVLAAVSMTILVFRRSAPYLSWRWTQSGFVPVREFRNAEQTIWMRSAITACSVLIALSLVYPAVATAPRLEERFPGHPAPSTLDALDWMRYGSIDNSLGDTIRFADDLAAIHWFQENVNGTPIIAEASIGPYRGDGSRFSIALGLPTVLGWARHERQQRYAPEIAQREQDVRDLYDSVDISKKREIIDRYGIEYIIIGDVERFSLLPGSATQRYASAAGIAALNAMTGIDLEVAFAQGSTIVYQVSHN